MAGKPFAVGRGTWWRIGLPLVAAGLLVVHLAWENGPRREAAAVSRPGECGKGAARQAGEPGVSREMTVGSYGTDNLPRMQGKPTFKVRLTVSPGPDRHALTLRTPLTGAVTVLVHAGRGGGLLAGARGLTARVDEPMYEAGTAPPAAAPSAWRRATSSTSSSNSRTPPSVRGWPWATSSPGTPAGTTPPT